MDITNPFRPGAGHAPPYMAGREAEKIEFSKLLDQQIILDNMVLTGLRGVGKTVLLETFKDPARQKGWRWVGTDLSETASTSEESLATRILTDLSLITSHLKFSSSDRRTVGFVSSSETREIYLDYQTLHALFDATPGLVADKLKSVMEIVWECLSRSDPEAKGVIFAYDEAQTLSDQADKEQYPLSVLLDVFQSIQKKGIPFMLVLTGLPTLFPKLVEARTYAERMFRVVFLSRLSDKDSKKAISRPLRDAGNRFDWDEDSILQIISLSDGYPYFIQFICREVFDIFVQQAAQDLSLSVPVEAILRKLDNDFFQGRWSRATDRQRDLLSVIAELPNCDAEFTVKEIVDRSKDSLKKPLKSSHVNQMLSSLGNNGLVYKNRHGKYSFAVPLLGKFIRRQQEQLRPNGQGDFGF